MNEFWIIGSLMLVASIFGVLFPLMRSRVSADTSEAGLNRDIYRQRLTELTTDRDNGILPKAQFEKAKLDLYTDLLHDADAIEAANAGHLTAKQKRGAWALALLMAILIPALSYWLYSIVGASQALPMLTQAVEDRANGLDLPDSQQAGGAAGSMDDMVARLEERLQAEPNNPEGWVMMGRSYMVMERHTDAAKAFATALEQNPPNAQLLTNAAQAEGMAAGRDFTGERPLGLLRQAIALEPENMVAGWLLGFADFQAGNAEDALQRWQELYKRMDPASPDAQQVAGSIAMAQRDLGIKPSTPTAAAPTEQPVTASANERIKVRIDVDRDVAAGMSPDTTVFVFARAQSGPPMPLAAKRLTLAELPAEVILDDSAGVMPQMKLSGAQDVHIAARISKSGQAMPGAGDLESSKIAAKPGQQEIVQVLINQVRQ